MSYLMGDLDRIDAVLQRLRSWWLLMPDLRLLQLLGNAFPAGTDPYYVEDDALLEQLERTYSHPSDSHDVRQAGLWEIVAYVARLHAMDVDKAGEPYVGHVLRVWHGVWEAGGTAEAQMAALLHDVMEDHQIAPTELRVIGVPDTAIEAVTLLTRQEDVPKEEYYRRILANPIALIVKRADVADNSDPRRLSRLEPGERRRLGAKYAEAQRFLGVIT